MKKQSYLKIFPVTLVYLAACVISNAQNKLPTTVNNFFTQGNNNRTAAEWEPALGTMLVWPLCVPYKLVIELAKDNHLFTLVASDSAKNEATKWYTQWGIDPASNTFIITPQGIDAWWVRDWGPSAVFKPNGNMMLGDGKYIYSTPVTNMPCTDSLYFIYQTKDHQIIKTETEDNATIPLGKGLKTKVMDLPYINTGGNVLTDGVGTAFSTCILLNENKFYNVSKDKFLGLNKTLLGFSRYNIISNFENRGIQHIDCLLKLLDEERILVAEPPKDHPLFAVYENIIASELSKLKTVYGRSYKILRIKTHRYEKQQLAAYTNSIIINKTIYVPLFNIEQDSSALHTWQELMPGYTVKGFTFNLKDEPIISKEMTEHYANGYGWDAGDALHCRTRAVWDSEMLFLSIKKLDSEVTEKDKNIVYTTIIDYSQKGLVKDQTQLYWRVAGENDWQKLALNSTSTSQHYFAAIPYHQTNTTIEYYISANSKSGRTATQPATAPVGFYQFRIK